MLTSEMPVCSLDVLGNGVRHFYSGELYGLLEQFPVLEFPHRQDFYMILYIESAEGEISIDHHKIRLDKAKVVIIRPHCIVGINIYRESKGKLLCFTENFFSLRYNNNILYQFSFFQRNAKSYLRLNQEQKGKWDILFNLLLKEHKDHRKESQKVLRSYLNILLYELERIYNPNGLVKNKSLKLEKIQQFEELIDKHFVVKKLPSDYAKLLHVSPNYLNKICKEETGQTAGDLVRKRITTEAQRMLHYSHQTVSEIADQLGFESVSYFVTFFKKNTGLTPERFRKTHD